MEHRGIKINGWVTSDFPIKEIDSDQFMNEFIDWIESKNYLFIGSCGEYKYELTPEEEAEG